MKLFEVHTEENEKHININFGIHFVNQLKDFGTEKGEAFVLWRDD